MPLSKRCIVVAVQKDKGEKLDECVEFYALDADFIPLLSERGQSQKKAIYPTVIKDLSQVAQPLSCFDHSHTLSSYTSFGSHVYRGGGLNHRCEKCTVRSNLRCKTRSGRVYDTDSALKYVDRWDTIDNSWTSLPPMNLARDLFDLHVLRGKLYAIGGVRSREKGFIFIEMFDESVARWVQLRNPPPVVDLDLDHFMSVAIEHKGFILFGSRACESFYAFTPPSTWQRLDHLPFDRRKLYDGCFPSCSPIVVVGDHVIWLERNFGSTLFGIHIGIGYYFEIDLVSEGLLPKREFLYYYPQLVRFENDVLALVWTGEGYYILEGESKVEYEKQYNGEAEFRPLNWCLFSIDFVRACAGEKCCQLLSRQRCIGPNLVQTPRRVSFAVHLALLHGNPSNPDVASFPLQQKRKLNKLA